MNPRGARALAVGLALCALGACGVRPLALARPGVAAPARSASAAPLPPSPAPSAPWRLLRLPSEQGSRVIVETNTRLLAIQGGMRIEVEQGRYSIARQITASPLLMALPLGEGWRFATRDGALFRAAGFLGDLERLDEAPATEFREAFDAQGVLALHDTRGDLWLASDGLRRVTALPAGGVFSAVFSSPLRGVVSAAPGQLFETVDGGESFVAALPSVLPEVQLWRSAGALAVRPLFARLGHLRGAQGTAQYAPPEDLLGRTLEGDFALDATLPLRFLSRTGALLSDGSAVLSPPGELVLYPVDGAPSREALPEPRWCTVVAAGARVYARCEEGILRRPARVFERTGERRWRLRFEVERARRLPLDPSLAATEPLLIASEDGAELLAIGACAGGPGASAQSGRPVCWFDGARARTRQLDDRLERVGSLADGRFVFQRTPDAEHTGWMIADLRDDNPVERVVGPAERRGAQDLALVRRDGDAVTFLERDDGRAALRACSGTNGDGVSRPLPAGVERVAFASAMHGVALGATTAAVWTTEDGGAHWQARGVASPSAVEPFCEYGVCAPLVCSAGGCVVGRFGVWAPERVFGWARSLPEPAARQAPLADAAAHDADARPAALSCALPEGAPGAATTTDHFITGNNGWCSWPRSSAAQGAAVRWGGADALGAFESRGVVDAPLARALLATPSDPSYAYRVALATREALLLEARSTECPTECARHPARWLLVSRRGPAHEIDLARVARLELTHATLADALPLPAGGVALRWTSVAPALERDPLDAPVADLLVGPADIDAVATFDARGRLRAHRVYAMRHAGTTPRPEDRALRGLALGPEGAGLAVLPLEAGAPVRVLPVDVSRPERALPYPAGTAPLRCTTATAPDATIAALRAPPGSPVLRLEHAAEGARQQPLSWTLEWHGGGGACVRGLALDDPGVTTLAPGRALAFALIDARLRGHALGPGAQDALVCTEAAP